MSDVLSEFVSFSEDSSRQLEKERIIDNNEQQTMKRLLTREELAYVIDFLEIDPNSDWELSVELYNKYKRDILKEIYKANVYVYSEEDDVDTLQRIRNEYEKKFYEARLHAGTPVGAVASGSLGEPTTQMVLNSFHTAGQAVVQVLAGIPRIEELMAATKKPKKKSLLFQLQNLPLNEQLTKLEKIK